MLLAPRPPRASALALPCRHCKLRFGREYCADARGGDGEELTGIGRSVMVKKRGLPLGRSPAQGVEVVGHDLDPLPELLEFLPISKEWQLSKIAVKC